MVIVEYCRFGNLHNFLMRNRRGFVSEIENNSLAVGSCSNSLEPLLQIQKTTPRSKFKLRIAENSISFGV